MTTPSPGINQLSLARFAFNIYGSLNDRTQKTPDKPKHVPLKKLKYICDREITCVSQLLHPVGRSGLAFADPDPLTPVPAHHVLIGGKNYLKLLALSADQADVVADFNLIDTPSSHLLRLHTSLRLFNVNTIKTKGDMVACGLTSGSVHVYQMASSGRAKLAHRLDDHKRVVNSLDFVEQENVLFSGSQDGTVRLWDLRLFSPKPALKLMASQHADPVRSCQYSPHSKVRGKMSVLSVHDSGALCKYDLRYPGSSNSTVTLPERKWTFHTGPALSLHIHPELEYVLTGGRDRKICLWNYGDAALNSMAPETSLNTYGPVMKIRWNDSPNDEAVHPGLLDPNDEFHPQHQALYNYDFACLYLNDDPSISVFNLARKYIPKEVVNTLTRKPFQNFIWAKSPPGGRRLWTITKSNVFVSYDLNSSEETAQNILRPLETLPSVTTSWCNGFSNLSVVSQDPADFDLLVPISSDSLPELPERPERPERPQSEELRVDEDRFFEHQVSPVPFETSLLPNRALHSHPTTPTYFYQKSSTLSPKERPMLLRLSTQHSHPQISSSLGLQRSNLTDLGISQTPLRPSLNRNPSQTTVDSASLGSTVFQPVMNHGSNYGSSLKHPISSLSLSPSPYLVSMSLPLPLADETVFAALANDYLTGVPDAFSLSFVCQINARVAASVQRFRDCQTWRMISVALEQQDESNVLGLSHLPLHQAVAEPEDDQDNVSLDVLSRSPGDTKSISSDLGNVVGSYNSDSTLTTNYGSGPRKRSNASSMNNLSILGSSRELVRGEHLLRNVKAAASNQSLMEFAVEAFSPGANPGIKSRTNSLTNRRASFLQKAFSDIERKNSIALVSRAEPESSNPIHKAEKSCSPNPVISDKAAPPTKRHDTLSEEDNSFTENKSNVPTSKGRPIYGNKAFNNLSRTSHDLDDENLNVMTNASASFSSSAISANVDTAHGVHLQGFSVGSRDSPAGSWHSLGSKSFTKAPRNMPAQYDQKMPLDRVEESSIQSKDNQTSQLTKAMSRFAKDDSVFRPWHAVNIIKKSLEYALAQGDMVMSATLILLFYDYFHVNYTEEILDPQESLEVLGLYVDTLRAKEMYTIAVQVVNDSPTALKERLCEYAVKEVEMRFYCCWCKTLLTNEMSKAKYGVDSDKFGFWYCDECKRKQLNCVYCNEPCKGLTVVESLRCGHRGHFGCFQEWHIEDGNSECPGGCE